MIDIDKVLDAAKEKDASDVHLICNLKPMLRIRRNLIEYDCSSPLTEDDMYDIYDYFVRGNVDKDNVFKEKKKLDMSYEFEDIRLRVNISLADEIPIFTLRLIKNELPTYEELGVPDIVRRMTYQPQGLILVTGKTNSGKTTTLNALINEINENQNKKILTLESPVEYKHTSKKSVNRLNLNIQNGEIFGFLGPNGAGKTTTIRMITGILNIDEGDILIDGKSIKKEPLEAKKNFGFVPDSPDMFLKLKGIEYLMFMADVYDIPQDKRKDKIEELTKKFEIYNDLNNQIQSYSHGMRQKIVICGALLAEPKNWILDEPMTGLDPKSSYDLKEMMRQHAKSGKTVFFSTHILEVAEKLCDRVGIINKGKLVFVGTFDEMKQKFKENASLEDLFLEITEK